MKPLELKKLIKEELNSIEEARPPTKNRGVIQFEGYKLVYYVYPMNVTTRDNVEGFKGKGLVGHYKVEKDSDLYQAISGHYQNSTPNDVYVVGLENREMAQVLISNNQIETDKS